MKIPSFQDSVGFSVKDTLALYWLHVVSTIPTYPRDVYQQFAESFPGRKVGYEYVARVAKQMESNGFLTSTVYEGKKVYSITDEGIKRLHNYQNTYFKRFNEVATVINRMYYHLTHNGKKPEPTSMALHPDFRPYLAKLLSVKDVVRYMALKMSLNRSSFYMAEVGEQLDDLFGWSPSNGYLYQLAREMEETDLLFGQWRDERRTVRILKGTDAGNLFLHTVERSLLERVTSVRTYLHYILKFLDKEKSAN